MARRLTQQIASVGTDVTDRIGRRVGIAEPLIAPFTKIPEGAHPFYVSDSRTDNSVIGVLTVTPGSWNMDVTYPAGQTPTIYIIDLFVGCVAVGNVAPQGVNVDLQIGWYNNVGAFVAGSTCRFVSPYGTAANGQLGHSSAQQGGAGISHYCRFGDRPMMLGGFLLPAAGSPFQFGAIFTINAAVAGIPVEIDYHVHGAAL